MNEYEVVEVFREAIWLLIRLSMPFMAVALVVGLTISIIQALTQIQEMTISFVPKMIAMYITLVLMLPTIITSISEFNAQLADRIIKIQ